MITSYIETAMRHAHYEKLEEDGTFCGEIPPCRGVFANAASLEECRSDLVEVLEDWVLFRTHQNLDLPVIDGIGLSFRKEAAA